MERYRKGMIAVVVDNDFFDLGNSMVDIWLEYSGAESREEQKQVINSVVKEIQSNPTFPYNNHLFHKNGYKHLSEIAEKYGIHEGANMIKDKSAIKEIKAVIQKYKGDEMDYDIDDYYPDAIIFESAPEGFIEDLRKALENE